MLHATCLAVFAAAPPGLPVVEAAPAVFKTVTETRRFSGTVQPSERAKLVARVGGQITKIAKPDGGPVKKGELLFQIDDRMYRLELAKAEALLARAEARLARATTDLDRLKRLGAASKEEFAKAEAAKQEASAESDAAKADVQLARLRVEMCKVIAPIAGRVSRPSEMVGGIVKADETHLATIEGAGPYHVVLDVGEGDFARHFAPIRDGKAPAGKEALDVEVWLYHVGKTKGRITFIEDMLDPTSKTGRVRIGLPKDADATPGKSAEVAVKSSAPFEAAVFDSGRHTELVGGDSAIVVDKDGSFRIRSIKWHQDYRLISGIQPGDRLYGVSHGRLLAGSKLAGKRVIVVEPRPKPKP